MIYLPESTRNEYKDYDRQMQVFANLYLAEKHFDNNGQVVIDYSKSETTTNLIKELVYNQKNQLERYVNRENRTIMLMNSNANITSWVEFLIKDLPVNTQLTLSCYYRKNKEVGIEDEPSVNMSIRDNNNNVLTSVSNLTDRGGNIVLHFTTTTSTIKLRAGINIAQSEYSNTKSVVTFDDLMLVQGTNTMPFERAYSSPFKLTEENNCKVLSFNINEKTDVYYTSLPYNEMTIEVDNENGYFTDYSPNCILPLLNSDCYVDLFMKINDGQYYKIMSMNFDEVISTNYEKAKLSFSSTMNKLTKLEVKDKNYQFFNTNDIMPEDIQNYFLNNYNILVDNSIVGYTNLYQIKNLNLQNLLLEELYNFSIITTNYNNDIIFKDVAQFELHEPTLERITNNLQLDRPTITKTKEYELITTEYETGSDYEYKNYHLDIRNTLDVLKDTIVISDKYAFLNSLTSQDIEVIGDVNVTLHTGEPSHIAVLELTGDVGTQYTITINKDDMFYDKPTEKILSNVYHGITFADDKPADVNKTKKIVFNNDISIGSTYFIGFFNFSQINSKVEVKCMGLPYLEIGDIVQVENYLTTTIPIAITDIDINYDGGCTMTIKGYSFDWSLFPADDLYPSDYLYPNKILN